MGPLGMMAVGAGMGLGKSMLFDAPAEAKQRQLAAQTAIYSPWTGLDPMSQIPKRTDAFGSAMQGGMAGAQMGMGLEEQKQQKEMLDLKRRRLEMDEQAAMLRNGTYTPPLDNAAPVSGPQGTSWNGLPSGQGYI